MTFAHVTATFAVLALIADGLTALLVLAFLLSRVSAAGRERWASLRDALTPAALPFAWIVAAVCMTGSLYLSEVALLIPCKLCWYQRICMYPLVVLLAIAGIRGDVRTAKRYLLPLASIGAVIATYHYQLERFPDEAHPSCALDAPCNVPVVDVWGWLSVPFMALAGFLLIITLLALARSDAGDEEYDDELDDAPDDAPAPAAAAG